MMISASDLPQKTVLSKYMDSKVIRKNFQSIQKSISASLSPTTCHACEPLHYQALYSKALKEALKS